MLEKRGVVGNRRFWLCDEQGALYGGKRDGTMLRIRPAWDEATRQLALTFPTASWSRVWSARRPGGRRALPAAAALASCDRPVGGSDLALVGKPLTFLWADDGAVDRTPEGGTDSLVSGASLERLREEAGVGEAIDGRRFRMLFEIDGVQAHEEDAWIGQPSPDRPSDGPLQRRHRSLRGHLTRSRHRRDRSADAGHPRQLPPRRGAPNPCPSASTDRSSLPAASVSATR